MGQWGIPTRPSTTAHPQSDGQSKRSFQTLLHYIRTTWQQDWPIRELPPSLEFAANNTRRESAGTSPFQIISNYQTRKPFTEEIKDYWPANIKKKGKVGEIERKNAKYQWQTQIQTRQIWEGRQSIPRGGRIKTERQNKQSRSIILRSIQDCLKNKNNTYKLALPKELGWVHNTFYVSKLRSLNKIDQVEEEKREKENGPGSSGNNITSRDISKNKEREKIEECKTEPSVENNNINNEN
jgi:hypothetical protein